MARKRARDAIGYCGLMRFVERGRHPQLRSPVGDATRRAATQARRGPRPFLTAKACPAYEARKESGARKHPVMRNINSYLLRLCVQATAPHGRFVFKWPVVVDLAA